MLSFAGPRAPDLTRAVPRHFSYIRALVRELHSASPLARYVKLPPRQGAHTAPATFPSSSATAARQSPFPRRAYSTGSASSPRSAPQSHTGPSSVNFEIKAGSRVPVLSLPARLCGASNTLVTSSSFTQLLRYASSRSASASPPRSGVHSASPLVAGRSAAAFHSSPGDMRASAVISDTALDVGVKLQRAQAEIESLRQQVRGCFRVGVRCHLALRDAARAVVLCPSVA